MVAIFSPERRYRTWRELWVVLAKSQRELGLPITEEQIWGLEEAAPRLDLERVAELERETRHDVVAHLRHFAEQAAAGGGILHLGATSAFITDNTDVTAAARRARAAAAPAARARRRAARASRCAPLACHCLAYTHFQPAQLTTVGKRACLWAAGRDGGPRRDRPPAASACAAAASRARPARRRASSPSSTATTSKVARARRPGRERARLRRSWARHRPDLPPQAGQPGARGARRDRRELPQAGHRSAPAAGRRRARRAVRRRAGRLLGDGLQAQSGARRADVRAGAAPDDRRAERPAQRRDAVARAQPRRLGQSPAGDPGRVPHRRRHRPSRRRHRCAACR